MNKKNIAILILVIGAIVIGYQKINLSTEEFKETSGTIADIEKVNRDLKAPKQKVESHAHISNHQGVSNTDGNFKVAKVEIPRDRHGESLVSLSSVISEFGKKDIEVGNITKRLKVMGLSPVVALDKNEDTGDMHTIRTKNSLPGARYFHAQIFTGKEGKQFVQHMSFEYRPGKQAFAQGVATAIREFGLSEKAVVQKDGFYSWNTFDGYVVWVKRMTAEDLKSDPFNAYSRKDIGTIRIAKEIEIHGQDEGHEH